MESMIKVLEYLRCGDWEAAHQIVQADESTEGSWAHGIVHLMEGDLSNAEYWFRRAGRALPDLSQIESEIAELERNSAR